MRPSTNVRVAFGAVLVDDELPKGLCSQFLRTSYSHEDIYSSVYSCVYRQRQEEHDSHIVIPQLELLLPSPSLAHSPRIDYFATNYLQM